MVRRKRGRIDSSIGDALSQGEEMKLISRTGAVLIGLLIFIVSVIPSAAANDAALEAANDAALEQIRQAIREKGATWKVRQTSVWKLPPEERRHLLGAQLIVPDMTDITPPPFRFPQAATLTQWDWRDHDGHNWVTDIRNQGGCGSCVVFGCMAAFEAGMSIAFDAPEPTFDLSEQHVFSCGGGSCEYGWNVPSCLNYIREMGAPDEACYPYRAMDNQPPDFGAPCDETCEDWQIRARRISQWGWVPSYNEVEIKNALMNGPLPVYITVYSDFFAYSSGVYVRTSDHVEGGHIVCMVGWDDDENCWICKNSWGDWGEDGYFRIRKGTNEADIEASIAWLTSSPAEYPSLRLASYQVVDSLGDADNVLNPGETARLRLGLENQQTWAPATGVSAILSSGDGRIEIHDLLSIYGEDIGSGDTVWTDEDEFSLTVSEQAGVCDIPLTLEIAAGKGSLPSYQTTLSFNLTVTYNQLGWPIDLSAAVRSSPLIKDLDEDGAPEVIVVDNLGTLHVWSQQGQYRAGFPVSVPGQVWGSVAVGDLQGDGEPDIVFGSKNDTIYAFSNEGHRLFARDLGSPILSTPALADLDGNGGLETVVGTINGNVSVLAADGSDIDRFPISGGGPVFSGPALADLDGDDVKDIIWGSTDRNVYAVSSSTGESLFGFPFGVAGMVVSAPSVADLDEDGHEELIFGCDDGKLYVLSYLGEELFTVDGGQMIRTSAALGDVDADGHLDIVFSSKSGQVYAVDRSGQVLSGWPYQAGAFVESSPAIIDMDGDGLAEVIFGTADERLCMVSGDGTLLEEYPTPETGAIYSSPCVGDLDGDGDLEVVLGTPSGLSIWDFKIPAGDSGPWTMYRGNCRRTGYYGDNPATEVVAATAREGLPETFSLFQNYPNPFNARTRVEFVAAEKGRVSLEIFNILGQRVKTLVDGIRPAGTYQVVWDGTDDGGFPVASGIYFYRLRGGHRVQTRRMVLLR
jgi:C1A family cysteine protease